MRVCRVCGREYRGLVCQACHPRGSRRAALRAAEAVQREQVAIVETAKSEMRDEAADTGAGA